MMEVQLEQTSLHHDEYHANFFMSEQQLIGNVRNVLYESHTTLVIP